MRKILILCLIFLVSKSLLAGTLSKYIDFRGDAETFIPQPLRSDTQQAAGVAGGEGWQMIMNIAYAPSNANRVYSVVDTQSGVWRSDDGGANWYPQKGTGTGTGFISQGGFALGVDPLNPDVVLVGGGGGATAYNGVYISQDGGNTWSLGTITQYSKNDGVFGDGTSNDAGEGEHFAFNQASYNGTSCQTVWAGTHDVGVVKTTDGGATWAGVGTITGRVTDLAYSESENLLYVAAGLNLYRLNTLTNTSSEIGDFTGELMSMELLGTSTMLAACGTGGVYKSTNVNSSASFSYSGAGIGTGSTKLARVITASPADANTVYCRLYSTGLVNKNPYYSTNGGSSWSQCSTQDVSPTYSLQPILSTNAIRVAPHPTVSATALTTFQSTIFKTINGLDWDYSSSGFRGARIESGQNGYAFLSKDSWYYACVDFSLTHTANAGKSWTNRNTAMVSNSGKNNIVIDVDKSNPDNILSVSGSYSSQRIVRSTNGGASWANVGTTTGYDYDSGAIKFNQNNPTIAYAGGTSGNNDYSFKSLDGGATWSDIATTGHICCVDPTNGDIVYAIDRKNGATSDLYKSTDAGTSWSLHSAITFDMVREISVNPHNPAQLMAASQEGVFLYTAGAWTEIALANGVATSPTSTDFKSAIFGQKPNQIYVGIRDPAVGHTRQPLWKSENLGQTWEFVNSIGEYYSVWAMAINPYDGVLHLCTSHGNYVLEPEQTCSLSGTGTVTIGSR